MRNGYNARELRAFFWGFVKEPGDRHEHVTCWLCRQSGANTSPHANSLFAGKKQGISTKTAVFG